MLTAEDTAVEAPDVDTTGCQGVWDSNETTDAGDDPRTAGCQRIFKEMTTACLTAMEDWGDYCVDATGKRDPSNNSPFLNERILAKNTCVNGVPAPKNYDCRTLLNDQTARCVWKVNVCPLGNFLYGKDSAACEIPPVNPSPSPNPPGPIGGVFQTPTGV